MAAPVDVRGRRPGADDITPGPLAADLTELVTRRAAGEFELDEWGLDRDLLRMAGPLSALRWRVDVETAVPAGDALPSKGGVLVVFSRSLGLSEPSVVAAGLGRASGRPVRVVGVPDLAPLNWWLRRLGGVADRPEEVRGLLRAGQVVAAPLGRSPLYRRRPGGSPAELLAVAIGLRVPIVPVAVLGHEAGRRWRLRVAEPILPEGRRPRRATPVREADLGRVEVRVHDRIDELLG